MALVGTAEKGYYSVKVGTTRASREGSIPHLSLLSSPEVMRNSQVRVTTTGGHSSIPPLDHSSAAVLAARVIEALDQTPPAPALVPPITDFL